MQSKSFFRISFNYDDFGQNMEKSNKELIVKDISNDVFVECGAGYGSLISVFATNASLLGTRPSDASHEMWVVENDRNKGTSRSSVDFD